MSNFFLCRGTFLKSTLGQHKVIPRPQLGAIVLVLTAASISAASAASSAGHRMSRNRFREEKRKIFRSPVISLSPLLPSYTRRIEKSTHKKRERGDGVGQDRQKVFSPLRPSDKRKGEGMEKKIPSFSAPTDFLLSHPDFSSIPLSRTARKSDVYESLFRAVPPTHLILPSLPLSLAVMS